MSRSTRTSGALLAREASSEVGVDGDPTLMYPSPADTTLQTLRGCIVVFSAGSGSVAIELIKNGIDVGPESGVLAVESEYNLTTCRKLAPPAYVPDDRPERCGRTF